jgi:hypothetical protein
VQRGSTEPVGGVNIDTLHEKPTNGCKVAPGRGVMQSGQAEYVGGLVERSAALFKQFGDGFVLRVHGAGQWGVPFIILGFDVCSAQQEAFHDVFVPGTSSEMQRRAA